MKNSEGLASRCVTGEEQLGTYEEQMSHSHVTPTYPHKGNEGERGGGGEDDEGAEQM